MLIIFLCWNKTDLCIFLTHKNQIIDLYETKEKWVWSIKNQMCNYLISYTRKQY